MDYVKLGRTGLDVSRLCLGCMSYGASDRGNHPWTLSESESRPFIKQALDHGINFFDTANVYSDGTSEEIVGRALKDFAKREEIVIATKVHGRMRRARTARACRARRSWRRSMRACSRLGTDYVDLYQIHRWDYATPIEETMEALHDVVKAGKARYIGASSMYAWQFSKALHVAEQHGWTRFVTMQNYVNLLYREEEREMLPLCASEGIGVIPWSPLARGRLTRDWDTSSARSETDEFGSTLYAQTEDADRQLVERVSRDCGQPRRAARAGCARVGAAKERDQRADCRAPPRRIISTMLSRRSRSNSAQDEVKQLEELYVPHAVTGFK